MTGRTAGRLALVAVAALVVAVFVVRACGAPSPPVATRGPVAVLPDTEVRRDRPTTSRTLGERLTTKRAHPAVALSAGAADSSIAERYARLANLAAHLRRERDSLAALRAGGDTAAHPERVPVAAAVLPPAQFRVRGRSLTVWGVRSDGVDARAMARLGYFHPHVDVTLGMGRASDSLPVIDVDRWYTALARQSWKCAPPALVAGGIGALAASGGDAPRGRGALAGGLVLLGCLVG